MRSLITSVLLGLCCLFGSAHAALDPAVLQGFASEDFGERLAVIGQLGQIGDEDARRVLEALENDSLAIGGGKVLIYDGEKAIDAASGVALEAVPEDIDTLTVNNRMRTAIEAAKAGMALFSTDPTVRLTAATRLRDGVDATTLPLLEKALASEQDAAVHEVLTLAVSRGNLGSGEAAKRLSAAIALADSGDPSVLALLEPPEHDQAPDGHRGHCRDCAGRCFDFDSCGTTQLGLESLAVDPWLPVGKRFEYRCRAGPIRGSQLGRDQGPAICGCRHHEGNACRWRE